MNKTILIVIVIACAVIAALAIMWCNYPFYKTRILLHNKDVGVRLYALAELTKLNDRESIPQITKLLEDADNMVRSSAVKALGELGVREVIPLITKVLEDKDSWVRGPAVYALGNIGAKEAIPLITKLLEDENSWVRAWAAIALVELGAKDKVTEETIKDIKYIRNESYPWWSDKDKKRIQAALKELGVPAERERSPAPSGEEEIQKAKEGK